MEKLHPGARWSFRFSAYAAFLGLLIFLTVFTLSSARILGDSYLGYFTLWAAFLIVLIIIVGEIYARLAYNNFAFEFSDTNLKIERGIIWKVYSNVPYERVQNVDITRGIIARLVGFSTVNIQTAGYSMGHNGRGRNIEGYIPAVAIDKAEHIRDFLMKKIGRRSGL